jgi:tetratricopeptide (TPR) repeat protein
MKKKLVFALVAILVIVLGAFITARAAAPTGIEYDPKDVGYCASYGITIDASQVDTIYLHPETILADPDAFLNNNLTNLMLAQRHMEMNDLVDVERWIKQIEKIADLPIQERERQIPYTFSQDVLAGRETFCKIAVPHILSYLPEGTEIRTTYYLATLDPINTGFHNREGILIGLSHPTYSNADRFFSQGNSSIYNIMAHELFHRGYKDAWLWQVETPLQNGALRDMITSLQNDGMAVNAAYRVTEYYPSSMDFTYPLHNFEPYVHYWIGRLNQVLENAESKTVDELYRDVGQLLRDNAHYIVGGYMAGRIEDQLGREALVNTVVTGPISFIQTYNSVSEAGMEIRFIEPEHESTSIYQDLRATALEGELDRVREILETIQENPGSFQEIEAGGYFLFSTGYILLKSGHFDLAEETFQAHINLLPQIGAAYVGLGDVYAQKGAIATAIENYERAIELDQRNLWVKVVIAKLETKNGDQTEISGD